MVYPTSVTIIRLQSLHLVTDNLQGRKALVCINLDQTPEPLKTQTEADVTTATQPTNEINVVIQCNNQCHSDMSFILFQTESIFSELLWP